MPTGACWSEFSCYNRDGAFGELQKYLSDCALRVDGTCSALKGSLRVVKSMPEVMRMTLKMGGSEKPVAKEIIFCLCICFTKINRSCLESTISSKVQKILEKVSNTI